MMIRRLALIAVAVMLAIAPTLAQDKPVTLKMSSWVPPAQPLNPSLIAWAADIEKESGGSIKATLFPSEQLGKAFDHYDMARDGIADLAYVNPGYQPGRFPIGAEVRYGRADVHHDVRLDDEPGEIQLAVGGAAQGHRRSLHQ